MQTRGLRCLLGSEKCISVTHRGIGNYTPERIAQARKEIKRFQRLDQYGKCVKSVDESIAITLDHLEEFGRNCDEKKFLLSAQFCFRELPIRTLLNLAVI